jgi:hypothetical protein
MGAVADEMSATTKISVYEFEANQWVSFAMLSSFSNGDAKYPIALISGNYTLAQRFTRSVAWKSLAPFFDSMIEAAAKEAGFLQTT